VNLTDQEKALGISHEMPEW